MSSCQSEVLAENPHGYVSWCHGCQEFTFAWENLVFNFNMEHLVEFREWLAGNKENPGIHFDLPHGKSLIYPSPVQNLRVAFTPEEIDELDEMLTHVQLVMDARRIVAGD